MKRILIVRKHLTIEIAKAVGTYFTISTTLKEIVQYTERELSDELSENADLREAYKEAKRVVDGDDGIDQAERLYG